ncbi:MAG TPA: integrase arm-type DNA-binding domain-containing protein [Roseiarcus sp.]
MKLTDLKVRNAKPRAKPYSLPDGRSLRLAIQPTGGKLWRGDYRFDGKQKTLAMGCYPDVSLEEARRRWNEARKLKAQGIDPAAQRKADKHAKDDTFRAVGEELIAKLKREGRAHATLTKTRWLLGFAFAAFGEKRMAEITARDLLALLRTIEGRGLYETAGRLRGTCGMVFRYAIATGRAERDPSADLRGALTAPVVSHRASVVDAMAIGALLRAIDGFDGQPTTHAALRLAPYVFVRPGELRGAEWNELDLDAAVWSIPATKMKMRRPHRVPLARQSLVILRDLQGLTGSGRFLFPSVRTVTRTISENTLNAALRRLGYGSEEMSTHGFRSMAATRLNEMGRWNPDAIERQLAHQEANAVRRAYTHAAEFWSERVTMMQAWADHLDGLREVSPLHAAR